jgi:hypothetical protein
MNDLARRTSAGKALRRPDAMAPSDRLRDLARQLARLNVTGRLDPEQIVGAKHAIVRGMDRLAAELDR